MATIFPGTYQVRRKYPTSWVAENYILLPGEIGVEIGTNKFKFGDGASGWNALGYASGGGSGGATVFSALVDATTANLPATNNPLNAALATKALASRTVNGYALTGDVTLSKADLGLSAVDNTSDSFKPVSIATQVALNNKQAALVSGTNIKTVNGVPLLGSGDIAIATGAAILTTYTTAIPLDVPGNGRYFAQVQLTANSTFTIAASPVEQGSCNFSLLGDGSHSPDFSAFFNANGYTYNPGLGANNKYSAYYSQGVAELWGYTGKGTDITAPTLVSATAPDSDAGRINLVWSESVDQTIATPSSAFAVSAGHALTAHTYDSATTSHLTTSTPFIQGETARTLAYTQPGSLQLRDLAGNLLANISSAAITNSVTNPQISAISVQNSSPTRIDLTWSDTISSTISAAAAFTVSAGHAITAHTYVDSTHTYLTTSTAFVGGEAARTLTYVVPGTNPVKDLNVPANLSLGVTGMSITNNVVASTRIADNFNRADATYGIGTASDGIAWTIPSGGAGCGDMDILSNKARHTGGQSNSGACRNGTVADGTVSALLTRASNKFGFYLRGDGTFSNYIMLTFDGLGEVRVATVIAGTETAIYNTGSLYTAWSGAETLCSVTLLGSAYTIKVAGATVATLTSTQFQTQTYFGPLSTNGGVGNLFDDFTYV